MGRVGTRSNRNFTVIPTVRHVRGRKYFLVVETPKTLFEKVQKVQKVQNSKNSHDQTRKRVYTCMHTYIRPLRVYTRSFVLNGVEIGNPENFPLQV